VPDEPTPPPISEDQRQRIQAANVSVVEWLRGRAAASAAGERPVRRLPSRWPQVDDRKRLFPLSQHDVPSLSEVPEGWLPLVGAMFAKIENALSDEEIAALHKWYVREKRGELRVDVFGATDAALEVIGWAEDESARVCMRCGAVGTRRAALVTLCARCAAKEGYRE